MTTNQLSTIYVDKTNDVIALITVTGITQVSRILRIAVIINKQMLPTIVKAVQLDEDFIVTESMNITFNEMDKSYLKSYNLLFNECNDINHKIILNKCEDSLIIKYYPNAQNTQNRKVFYLTKIEE